MRPNRLIAAIVLVAFSGALGGCSSGFGGFDPTDMLDFLDTKKKLPGERKPVFPDGVPGLEQGVPKDLYKGARQQEPLDQPSATVAAAPAAPPPEEPRSAAKKGSKGRQAAAPAAAPPQAAESGETLTEEDTTPAAPPAPKPKKMPRKRITTPDAPAATQPSGAPQSAQAPAPFPAPLPSGTFTR